MMSKLLICHILQRMHMRLIAALFKTGYVMRSSRLNYNKHYEKFSVSTCPLPSSRLLLRS